MLPSAAGSEAPSTSEESVCRDFERDVERFWGESARAEVQVGMLSAGASVERERVERVVTGMDEITKSWTMLRESTCRDAVERELITKSEYARITSCLDVSLTKQRVVAELLASADQEVVQRARTLIGDIGAEAVACRSPANREGDAVPPGAREPLARAMVLARLGDARARSAIEAVRRDVGPDAPSSVLVSLMSAEALVLADEGLVDDASTRASEAHDLAVTDGLALAAAEVRLVQSRIDEVKFFGAGTSEHLERALERAKEATLIRRRELGSDALLTQRATRRVAYLVLRACRAGGCREQVTELRMPPAETREIWWQVAFVGLDMLELDRTLEATAMLSRSASEEDTGLIALIEAKAYDVMGDRTRPLERLAEAAAKGSAAVRRCARLEQRRVCHALGKEAEATASTALRAQHDAACGGGKATSAADGPSCTSYEDLRAPMSASD